MTNQQLPILIVNDNDEPIGSASKSKARAKGLIHRIVQVMVEDNEGRILLQKRAANLELHPGLWDIAVGGHVDVNEDYIDSAYREMFEEIGLDGVKLQEIAGYRKDRTSGKMQLKRFYKVYRVIVAKNTKFKPDPREVEKLDWLSIDQVKKLIRDRPDQVTGGLIEAIERFYK